MSDQPIAQSDRGVYLTSMLWAIPVCFVLTIVATVVTLLVAQAGDPDFDTLGAIFSGIFFGFLIFFPTCFVSIPVVGLTIAGVRLFVRGREHRAHRDEGRR